MKIVFWGNGRRGCECLKHLVELDYDIPLVVFHPGDTEFEKYTRSFEIKTVSPEDPNGSDFHSVLKEYDADLFVLAGYGKILKQSTIDLPREMCLNLHGGRLPAQRGSSPMNWSIINGQSSFGISVIRIDSGVDTGDVIVEREFDIGINDTIVDLHRIANENFPSMLVEAIDSVAEGSVNLQKQDDSLSGYYPLRFPDDGVIFWDQLTAEQVHNRIRALTDPYPGAFTFYGDREVELISSRHTERPFYGQPGRIYRKDKGRLLVCCSDLCLWIKEARFRDTGDRIYDSVKRYEKFLTVTGYILDSMRKRQG